MASRVECVVVIMTMAIIFITLSKVAATIEVASPPGYILHKDEDCWGGDFSDANVFVTTAGECADICDQTDRCVGFVLDHRRSTWYCWTKQECGELQPLTDVDTYKKDSPPHGYVYKPNKDCAGNDFIGVNTVTSTQQCADLCDQTEGCVAFVFDRRVTSNNCWAKNVCKGLVPLDNVATYQKEITEVQGFSFHENQVCDQPGSHDSIVLYTPQKCAKICKQTEGCTAFYITLDESVHKRVCWMVDSCDGLAPLIDYHTYIMENEHL